MVRTRGGAPGGFGAGSERGVQATVGSAEPTESHGRSGVGPAGGAGGRALTVPRTVRRGRRAGVPTGRPYHVAWPAPERSPHLGGGNEIHTGGAGSGQASGRAGLVLGWSWAADHLGPTGSHAWRPTIPPHDLNEMAWAGSQLLGHLRAGDGAVPCARVSWAWEMGRLSEPGALGGDQGGRRATQVVKSRSRCSLCSPPTPPETIMDSDDIASGAIGAGLQEVD